MNTEKSSSASPNAFDLQKWYLQQIEQTYEPAATLVPGVPHANTNVLDSDPSSSSSQGQTRSLKGAEKSAVKYWRNRTEQCAQSEVTGYSKFQSCAYVVAPEKQVFETPGMGLELECLTSFLSATHKNRILQNYVSKKRAH